MDGFQVFSVAWLALAVGLWREEGGVVEGAVALGAALCVVWLLRDVDWLVMLKVDALVALALVQRGLWRAGWSGRSTRHGLLLGQFFGLGMACPVVFFLARDPREMAGAVVLGSVLGLTLWFLFVVFGDAS